MLENVQLVCHTTHILSFFTFVFKLKTNCALLNWLLKMLWPIVLLGAFQLDCFTDAGFCVHRNGLESLPRDLFFPGPSRRVNRWRWGKAGSRFLPPFQPLCFPSSVACQRVPRSSAQTLNTHTHTHGMAPWEGSAHVLS